MSFHSTQYNEIYPKINMIFNKDKKINLKQNFYPKNVSQLKSYYTSLNTTPNSNIINTTNNSSDDKKAMLTKNFTFYSQETSPHLSKKDKKQLKLIIRNFDKHKVVTKELFSQEQKLRLNSINKTNYFFIMNHGKQNKNSRNKGRKLIKRMNSTDYSSSSMIDKFNNKTAGILDASTPERIFSKNLTKFTKQIINNFSDTIKIGKDLEFSVMKNKNAMKHLELIDNLYVKKAYETEKKFYEAKYNAWQNEKKNEIEKNNEKKENLSYIKNPIKDKFKSNDYLPVRTNIKTKCLRDENTLSKMNFAFITRMKRPKTIRNKTNLTENNNKSGNRINQKNKTNIERLNSSKNFKPLYYVKSSKSNNKLNIKDFSDELFMKEFHQLHNKKKLKKIIERSRNIADSIAEMSYMPYQPLDYRFININTYNLERVIKLNMINKHSKDILDNELLIHNPRILRDEILKTEMNYYRVNHNQEYKAHFLKKKLMPETIKKYAYIKDSYFGIPC